MYINANEDNRIFTMVFIFSSFLLFSETYDTIFYRINGTLIFFIVYIISFVKIAKRKNFSNAIYLILQEKRIISLILLSFISSSWSLNPEETINGSMTLLGTLIFAIYIVECYSVSQFMRILQVYFFLFCLINFLYISLGFGGIATGVHEGSWQGLLGQKNRFGIYLSIGFLVSFLALFSSYTKFRVINVITIIFSLFLIFKSDSKTALAITALVIILYCTTYIIKLNLNLIIAIVAFSLIILVFTCIYIFTNKEFLRFVLGGDLSLTGRVYIWDVIISYVQKSNYIGYGYNAFWNSSLIYDFHSYFEFKTISAHNGFLEVFLGIGIMGLLIIISTLTYYLLFSIKLFRGSKKRDNMFFVIFILIYIIYNFSESLLLSRNNFLTVIFFSIVYYLFKEKLKLSQK